MSNIRHFDFGVTIPFESGVESIKKTTSNHAAIDHICMLMDRYDLDPITRLHSLRVGRIAQFLALNIPELRLEEFADELPVLGFGHDLGKGNNINGPEDYRMRELLLTPEILSPLDMRYVQDHTLQGMNMYATNPFDGQQDLTHSMMFVAAFHHKGKNTYQINPLLDRAEQVGYGDFRTVISETRKPLGEINVLRRKNIAAAIGDIVDAIWFGRPYSLKRQQHVDKVEVADFDTVFGLLEIELGTLNIDNVAALAKIAMMPYLETLENMRREYKAWEPDYATLR